MADKIAGIDAHKKVLMVVVMDALTPESKPERRRFATMPSELRRLSTWLQERGVEEAVMESTAQYWRSVWLELEPHMCLHLAQAFSNRVPRGRRGELLLRASVGGHAVNVILAAAVALGHKGKRLVIRRPTVKIAGRLGRH